MRPRRPVPTLGQWMWEAMAKAETRDVYWPEWRQLSADQQVRFTAVVTRLMEEAQTPPPDEDD